MADDAAPAAANAAAAPLTIAQTFMRFMVVWMAVSMLFGRGQPAAPGGGAPRDGLYDGAGAVSTGPPLPAEPVTVFGMKIPEQPKGPSFAMVDERGMKLPPHRNLWPDGSRFDVLVYVSSNWAFDRGASLIWEEKKVRCCPPLPLLLTPHPHLSSYTPTTPPRPGR